MQQGVRLGILVLPMLVLAVLALLVLAQTGWARKLAGPRATAWCLHCVRQPVGPAQTALPCADRALRPRPAGLSWLPSCVQRCGSPISGPNPSVL